MNKIAVLILAHKNPGQLQRLVTALDDERFDIYIHIDGKSKVHFEAPKVQRSELCRILDSTERVDTYLNDFSLVDATMSLVRASLSSQRGYKYYILLTGQDYPIKSMDTIYKTLMENYPICWIDSYGVEDAAKHGVGWVEHVGHKRFSQKIRRRLQHIVGNRFYYSQAGKFAKIPVVVYDRIMNLITDPPRTKVKRLGFTYSVGSHFWILPDVAIAHLLHVYEDNKALSDTFRHTAAPEESYFQTALSTFDEAIIPEPYGQFESKEAEMDNPALRLIKWYEDGVHTSGHPASWSCEDIDFIRKSKALFARKFDGTPAVLNLIDEIR